MENQHRRIVGYRDLNENELALMNQIKRKGIELGELINQLENPAVRPNVEAPIPDVDRRWLSIGKTHLQQGLMALTRAVAKPEFF